MLQDAKDGDINLIIVKDLSRFGRNYIEVGQFTDYIFPAIGCRFVALHDNVDTVHNDNDIMAYKNLFNEFFARDTSKKVKTIRKARAESGKFMGTYAPYGYKKDSEVKHKLIIDEQTAPVVRRIFSMRCEGIGFYGIASALNNDKILPPNETYYADRGLESPIRSNGLWSATTVMRLMQNEVYIGNMVQLKTGSISFKNRKMINKPQDEWVRVELTHDPIIEQPVWDRVQEINAKKHKPRTTSTGECNMFTGILRCADCGYPLRYQARKYYHRDGSTETVPTFMCGNYGRSGKSACTAHIIQEKVLIPIVLADIRKNAQLVSVDEQTVIKEIIRMKNTENISQLASSKRELKNVSARTLELEKIIQNLYEDRVKGTIPETVFKSLIEKYEQERLDKSMSVETLQHKIASCERQWSDVSVWTNIIKRYTQIETLDMAILMELIDRIEIGNPVMAEGKRICDVRIFYRFVDNINLDGIEMEARHEQAV